MREHIFGKNYMIIIHSHHRVELTTRTVDTGYTFYAWEMDGPPARSIIVEYSKSISGVVGITPQTLRAKIRNFVRNYIIKQWSEDHATWLSALSRRET